MNRPAVDLPLEDLSAEQLLIAATVAWRTKVNAEGECARLKGYRHLSDAMRADERRHFYAGSAASLRLSQIFHLVEQRYSTGLPAPAGANDEEVRS